MRALFFFVADFGIQPFLPQRNRQTFAEFFGCVRILSFCFALSTMQRSSRSFDLFFEAFMALVANVFTVFPPRNWATKVQCAL